jgi:hypothetical protein
MEGEGEEKAYTEPFDAGIKSLHAMQSAEIFYWGF